MIDHQEIDGILRRLQFQTDLPERAEPIRYVTLRRSFPPSASTR